MLEKVLEKLANYLQLLGLNVDNSNSSPSVLLTDLVGTHYVLFLEIVQQDPYEVKLCIETSTSLHMIIRRCQQIGERPCITRRFGSGPTYQ